jgi:hypothetical protein
VKIPATINKIIANVPEITFVKNKTTTKAATSSLIVMSIIPMFFFIMIMFLVRPGKDSKVFKLKRIIIPLNRFDITFIVHTFAPVRIKEEVRLKKYQHGLLL